MKIETQATQQEYINFLKNYYFKRNLPVKIIFPLLITILVSFNIAFRNQRFWIYFISIFLIVASLFFLIQFLLPYWMSKARIAKRFNSNTGNFEKLTICLAGNGLDIKANDNQKFVDWKNIKLIDEYRGYLYITFYSNHFYLIANDSFHPANQKKAFLYAIQDAIGKTNPQNANRLYNRGWLGLIPLVGAFVGIWLIIMGISKYKDKKLIIIGTAAMLFTILIYASMFYYVGYSEQYRKDFSVFSQPYMNTLVKSIEFYKIQNGSYPDSLEEILVTDKMLMINDPILAWKPSINKGRFYYKKMGISYYLFSCGVDMIPYTQDDIFPSIELFDSTKTGLRHPIQ